MDKPVFYFTRFVPRYRVPVLEALNDRLDGRLIVCSGEPPRTSSVASLLSTQKTSYRRHMLKNRWLFGETLHVQPFREVFERSGDPAVLLAEESPRSVSLPFLLRHARKRGSGRVLWGHFSSVKRPFDPGRHLTDRYRLSLARSVEACACYTEGVSEMLQPYLSNEKLFVARNTIDIGPMLAEHVALAEEGKTAVRRRLGLPPDDPVLIFVGRLVAEKGTTELLETFRLLREQVAAVLLVVGEGPEREAMEARVAERAIDEVHFLGPRFESDLAPYLYAADVMVVPAYLGLAVNQAFAFGLPLATFGNRNPSRSGRRSSSHGPEVEYVRSGENGLLCEGDAPADLCGCIRSVLADLPRYSKRAAETARHELGLDRMIDGLHEAIEYAARRVG